MISKRIQKITDDSNLALVTQVGREIFVVVTYDDGAYNLRTKDRLLDEQCIHATDIAAEMRTHAPLAKWWTAPRQTALTLLFQGHRNGIQSREHISRIVVGEWYIPKSAFFIRMEDGFNFIQYLGLNEQGEHRFIGVDGKYHELDNRSGFMFFHCPLVDQPQP